MERFDHGDIKTRTFNLSKKTIELLEKIYNKNKGKLIINILNHLYRSITSVGANIAEADVTIYEKDFYRIIAISIRELKESQYWLKLLNESYNYDTKDIEKEVYEILKILFSIQKSK